MVFTWYFLDIFNDIRAKEGKDQSLAENQTGLAENLKKQMDFRGTLGTWILQVCIIFALFNHLSTYFYAIHKEPYSPACVKSENLNLCQSFLLDSYLFGKYFPTPCISNRLKIYSLILFIQLWC